MMDAAHRVFKDRLYGQFARIGKALGNPHRLELLELLAQGERTVDALATEGGLTMANASQHLLALREAGLVESRKEGLFVHYRLADPAVFELSKSLRTVAERRLAELERLVRDHFGDRSDPEPVPMRKLLERARKGSVVILDTRPAHEFAAGHIAGALSVPIEELQERLRKLPKTKEYVAYCRGPYCIYADRAVELLRKNGRRTAPSRVSRWKAAGHPWRPRSTRAEAEPCCTDSAPAMSLVGPAAQPDDFSTLLLLRDWLCRIPVRMRGPREMRRRRRTRP
jgi:DNA-binding transcriptional ArsR family regulator/rhodanese-related sulfurtransferase